MALYEGGPLTQFKAFNAGVIPNDVFGVAINWFVNRTPLISRLPKLPVAGLSPNARSVQPPPHSQVGPSNAAKPTGSGGNGPVKPGPQALRDMYAAQARHKSLQGKLDAGDKGVTKEHVSQAREDLRVSRVELLRTKLHQEKQQVEQTARAATPKLGEKARDLLAKARSRHRGGHDPARSNG